MVGQKNRCLVFSRYICFEVYRVQKYDFLNVFHLCNALHLKHVDQILFKFDMWAYVGTFFSFVFFQLLKVDYNKLIIKIFFK